MNWTIGRSIPCEMRRVQKESSLEAGEPELLPGQRRGCSPAACQARWVLRVNQCRSESLVFGCKFQNIPQTVTNSILSKPSWTGGECCHPKGALQVWSISTSLLCRVPFWRSELRVQGSENSHCCEEKAPPPLHEEEMAVFVAVFGEPQGVVDCNKQSHCHRSQTLTGCVSWKEKTMETSKVVPPPLGEPPSPSHSSYPPKQHKAGLWGPGGTSQGSPGANQRFSLKGKKESSSFNLQSIRSAETDWGGGFWNAFYWKQNTIGVSCWTAWRKRGGCGVCVHWCPPSSLQP